MESRKANYLRIVRVSVAALALGVTVLASSRARTDADARALTSRVLCPWNVPFSAGSDGLLSISDLVRSAPWIEDHAALPTSKRSASYSNPAVAFDQRTEENR
jgi:hypothetical protein